MTTIDRLLPQAIEAEEALLGSALIDSQAMDELDTTPRDFYREHNGWIWEVMRTLRSHGQPVDFLTVTDALGDRLNQLPGKSGYVAELINAVPTAQRCSS
jgi:replicative DNA helicase